MKKFLKVILSFIALIIICAVIIYFKIPKGKPIPTAEERISRVNNYVNNSLQPTASNMYLQIYPNKNFVTIDDYPELKDIVTNLNSSIKVKEEYHTDMLSFDIPNRVTFHWAGDTQIVIDIGSDVPSQVYVLTGGARYKAEASIDSIKQLSEFAAKFK